MNPDDLLASLNPPQAAAVTTVRGPVLVLAGAGSGKTRVLTQRIAYILAIGAARPGEILAFTFTNKAAREMKGRVERLLGSESAGVTLGTFHATSLRLLRRYGSAIDISPSFSVYDEEDAETVLRQVLLDLGISEDRLKPRGAKSRISNAKNRLLRPDDLAPLAETPVDEDLIRVYREYEARLRKHRALDFDDLIGEMVRLLAESRAVHELLSGRYRFVLVDEYQDTNHAQYRLIERLAATHRNLFVVGDDDQSIYGWRGADIGNILSFEETYPDATVIRLEQNYRSTQNILRAANRVVSRNLARKEKTLWTDRGDGDPLTFLLARDGEEEAAAIHATIRDEIVQRGVRGSEIAVLYRTHAQSREIENALRRAAVPYDLVGGVSFYERREVKDALAYLRLLVNPEDDVSTERILNVPRRGLGKQGAAILRAAAAERGSSLAALLDRLDEVLEIGEKPRQKLALLASQARTWREKLDLPADRTVEGFLGEVGLLDYFRSEDVATGEARAENLEELVVGAREYVDRAEDKSLAAFLGEVTLLTSLDLTGDAVDRVQLMSVHNAKGLEFGVVAIAGLEEGLFPHASSFDDEKELEEERRLFYVALTRAKDRAHLFAAARRRRYGDYGAGELSRFLHEIPHELVEERGIVRRNTFAPGGAARPRRGRPGAPSTAPDAAGSDAARIRAWNFGAGGTGPDHDVALDPEDVSGAHDHDDVFDTRSKKVYHPSYGPGVVLAVEGKGADARVLVRFAGAIQKKIVAKYLKWEDEESV